MIAGGASFIPSSWVLFMCLGVSVSDDGLGYLTRWSETGPDLPSAGNGTEVPLFGNETDVLSLGNETDSSPLVLLSNGTVINKSSPGKILYIPFRNSTRPKEDDESSYKKMNASYIRENLFTKKVPSEKRAIIPSRYHNPVPPKPATPNIYKELLDSPPIPSPATVEYEEGEDDYGPPFVPSKNDAVLSGRYGPNFPPWMHIGNSEDYRENVRAALAGFFHRFPQRVFEESVLVESEKDNNTNKQKVVLIVASPEDQLSEESTLPEPIYQPGRWTNRNRYRGVPPELIPHLFPEQIPMPMQPVPYPFHHAFNPRSKQGLGPSTGSEHPEVEEEEDHEEEGHGESHEEDDEGEHGEHEENHEHGSEHQKEYQAVHEEEEHDHVDDENDNEEDEDDDRPRNHVRTVVYGSSMPSFIPSSVPFPLREGHSAENSRGLSAYRVPYMLRMWDEVPQTTEETMTITQPSATTEEEEEYDDAEEDVGDLTAVDSGADVNATTETKNSSKSTVPASANSTTASPIVADASSVTSGSPQNATADGNQTVQKRPKRERQLISDDGKTFTPFDEKNPSSVRDEHLTVFPENHKVVKHVIPEQQLVSQPSELHSADQKSFLDAQFNEGDGSAFSNIPRSRRVRTKREPTKPCSLRQKREDAALPTSTFNCDTEDSSVQRLKRIQEVKDRLEQERVAQEAAGQKVSHDAQVKQDQELLRQIFDGAMGGEENEEEEKAESLQFDADDDDGEEDDKQKKEEQFQDDDDGENTDQEFQDDDGENTDQEFQDDDDGARAQKFDDDDDSTAEQKRNREDNVQLQEGDDGYGAVQTISEDEDKADVVMDNGGEVFDDQNDQEEFQDDGDSNYAFNNNGAPQTSQNSTVVTNSSSISGGSPSTTSTSATPTTTSTTTKKPVWEQEQLMNDDSDDGNTLMDDDDVGETLMDIESSEQFQDDDDGEQQFQDDDDGAQFQDDDDGQQSEQFQDDDDGEVMADDDDDGEEEATEELNDMEENEARLYDQAADSKDAERKETRKEKKAAKENAIWAHLNRKGGAHSVTSADTKPPVVARPNYRGGNVKAAKKPKPVFKPSFRARGPKTTTTKAPETTKARRDFAELDSADTADVQEDINFIREVAVLGPLFPPGTHAIIQPGRGHGHHDRPHYRSLSHSSARSSPSSLHMRHPHPSPHKRAHPHLHRRSNHPSHPHHESRDHRHRKHNHHEEIRNILTLNINLNSAAVSTNKRRRGQHTTNAKDFEFGNTHQIKSDKQINKNDKKKIELAADLKGPSEKEALAKVQPIVQADKKRKSEQKQEEKQKDQDKEEEKIVDQNDKAAEEDDKDEEEEEKEDFLDKEIKQQNHIAARPQLDMDDDDDMKRHRKSHKYYRRKKHSHKAQLDDDDDGRTRRVQRDVMFDGEPETVAIKLGSINGDGQSRRRKRILPL